MFKQEKCFDIEQIYTGCLSHAAYYIESNGECAIIDPLRDPQPYLDMARQSQCKIKYVLETHFHADFVSGHVDLANKSGGQIVFGPTAKPDYDVLVVDDGQELKLGDITIVALHTPGHTMESTTFLLRDETGRDRCLFTGDTLFLGDVGRPDLAQKAANMTDVELSGLLFDSLRTKIMPLADDVIVYPGHGAGSACGKNLSSDTMDTLGNQKKSNYALRADMTKEEFTKELLHGIHPPPEYFPQNVAKNKGINITFEDILEGGRKHLSLEDFKKLMDGPDKPLVIDTRDAMDFTEAFIPGSVFLGIDGGFAPYMGTAFPDLSRPVIFVPKDESRIDEIVARMARTGHDHVLGHLEGGFKTWTNAGLPVATISNVTPLEFSQLIADGMTKETTVVDVRRPPEVARGGIPDVAKNIPMMAKNFPSVPIDKPLYAFCAGGYRSVIFLSTMMSHYNVKDARNILQGFWGIENCEEMKQHIKSTPHH